MRQSQLFWTWADSLSWQYLHCAHCNWPGARLSCWHHLFSTAWAHCLCRLWLSRGASNLRRALCWYGPSLSTPADWYFCWWSSHCCCWSPSQSRGINHLQLWFYCSWCRWSRHCTPQSSLRNEAQSSLFESPKYSVKSTALTIGYVHWLGCRSCWFWPLRCQCSLDAISAWLGSEWRLSKVQSIGHQHKFGSRWHKGFRSITQSGSCSSRSECGYRNILFLDCLRKLGAPHSETHRTMSLPLRQWRWLCWGCSQI